VEYYEGVTKRMGADTPDFFRLFMVPGMLHCGDGVGTDQFDTLGALSAWVENRVLAGSVVRTRPLCAYPEVAKYKGSGSTDDAANFTCARQ
jgi:feruloyl esterase